ncbi:MAG: hypothetical protein AB7H97_18720 [Pseudobdellovibrionaceae bacterium]
MKMNLLKLGLVLFSVAGVASCGGNGGQPLTTTSIPTLLSNLNTSVLSKIPTSNTFSASSLPVSGATLNSGANIKATDCETSTPASTTDADSDGIALTKTSTFNCTDQTVGTYKYTRQGTYTITDLDDTTAGLLGGIQVDYELGKYNYTDLTNNTLLNNSYEGTWNFKKNTSGGVSSTSSFEGSTRGTYTGLSFAVEYDYGYTWEWSMVPTNSAAPWDAGTMTFAGTYSMSGTFSHESASGVHSAYTGTFVVKQTSKDLIYDTTCTKYIRSGSVYIDDYNSNVLEIRYACSTAKLYVNGVESDLYTF